MVKKYRSSFLLLTHCGLIISFVEHKIVASYQCQTVAKRQALYLWKHFCYEQGTLRKVIDTIAVNKAATGKDFRKLRSFF